MILLTRLNKEKFYLNEDKVEFLEETPDTIISLETGKKVVVMESAEEIIKRIRSEKMRYLAAKQKGAVPVTRTSLDKE